MPNFERASIPTEKLRDYALDMKHPKGRNKARVFSSVLGIEARHAGAFADHIRGTLSRAVAEKSRRDEYVERWVTYHDVVGLNGKSAIVTVAWIFRMENPTTPEFVTCYIEIEKQAKLAELFFKIE